VLADLLDASPSSETQVVLANIRGPSGSHILRRPQAPSPTAPAQPPSPLRPAAARRRRLPSRNRRVIGRPEAVPMSASCRCGLSARPRKTHTSPLV
jgi:hypothetical protein